LFSLYHPFFFVKNTEIALPKACRYSLFVQQSLSTGFSLRPFHYLFDKAQGFRYYG